MKKILCFAAFLGFINHASAQNTFPTGAGTNVGIGVINPLAPLHVQGGGTTTGIANIGTSLTARFNTANPPITLGIGYLSSDNPFLQAFNSTNNTAKHLILNPFGGNVGIGTNSPGASLSIVNDAPVIQLFDKRASPQDGSSFGRLAFGSANGEFASIEASRYATAFDDVALLKFRTSNAVGAGGDGTNMERMRINPNGNVGIGTPNPQNKLDVNGTIHSRSVLIDLNGWSDYVFKNDYRLLPLSEVKNYIDEHQHLPEIPSEQEMIRKGLDVSEMNKLLMKKVEELTLYLIEQDTEKKRQSITIELQESRLKQQQADIDQLKSEMRALIKH